MTLILIVLALICFIIAAFNVPVFTTKVNFVALGLALWVAASFVR